MFECGCWGMVKTKDQRGLAALAALFGMLASACLFAGPLSVARPVLLDAEGPLTMQPQQQQLFARRMALSERPGGHIPQQILRNINGLWSKSISGRRTKNHKTGGFNAPKQVLTGRGHQWGTDPYMVTQVSLCSFDTHALSTYVHTSMHTLMCLH